MQSSQPPKSLLNLRRNFEEMANECLDCSLLEGHEQCQTIAAALSSVLQANQHQSIPPSLRPWILRIVEVRSSPHLFLQGKDLQREFREIFTRCLQTRIQSLSSPDPRVLAPLNLGYPVPSRIRTQEETLLQLTDPGIGLDQEFLLSRLKEDPQSLATASPSLLNDETFMLNAIQRNPRAFLYASRELLKQRSFNIRAVQHNGLVIAYMDEAQKNDTTIFYEATLKNAWAALFAGDRIKTQPHINLRVVQIQPQAIRHIPLSFRYNRSFLLEAISASDGRVLEWLHFEERRNKDLLSAAIRICLNSMEYIPPEIRGNGEFLLDAIQIDERVYLHISDLFKRHLRFSLEAVKRNGLVLQFLSEETRNMSSVAYAAIENKADAAFYLKDTLMKNPSFILEAVQKNGLVLRYAPPIFRNIKAYVLPAVRNNGLALQSASDPLKTDTEVVYAALAQNPDAVVFVGLALQNDPVVLAALRSRPHAPASRNQSAACIIS